MTGEWCKKSRWKVGHLLRDDKRTVWMERETGWAACGCCIVVDEHLEDEPTGMDTTDRCGRCLKTLARQGEVYEP